MYKPYALFLLAGLPALAATYTASVFDLPGAPSYVCANGINNAGIIVGDVQYSSEGTTSGFVRSANGFGYAVFQAANDPFTVPEGINNAGVVVGLYSDGGQDHGFVRQADESIQALDVPGSEGTQPSGINDSSTITGFYWAKGGVHGFIRRADGAYSSLDFPGASATRLYGIANDGAMVGGYQVGGDWRPHGFLYVEGVGFTPIAAPGADWTDPTGINSHGDIAGVYGDMDGYSHGFVRLADGTFILIPEAWGLFGLNDSLKAVGMTNWYQGIIVQVDETPEPGTLALMGLPLMAMAVRRRLRWLRGRAGSGRS